MSNPTLQDIRDAVVHLKTLEAKPVGGYYRGTMSMRALVDLILTYKRPRRSRLYSKSATAAAYVDELIGYKRPRATKLYRSLS